MSSESPPLRPAELDWRDARTPVSSRFGDIYFSPEDGLAETRHVFLAGNGLPDAWRNSTDFVIGETGFGTGLNFLATWRAWRDDSAAGRRLHWVSVEGFPLMRQDLRRALAAWPELADLAAQLVAAWPPPHPGFHRLSFEGGAVTLTLLFGPVEPMLGELEATVDCWFLDGFAPSRNPEMWTEGVFAEVARLSRPGTRFATFSAAGVVRRGLEGVGFRTEKTPGFGRKRDMLRGAFAGPPPPGRLAPWFRIPAGRSEGRALVVGGGIAGACIAEALTRYGWAVTLAERHHALAREGSGNPAGIVMPRLVVGNGPEQIFHSQAYLHALRRLAGSSAFHPCGVLDLVGNPTAVARGILPPDQLCTVDAVRASALAGLSLDRGGLWFPNGGWLDPVEEIARLTARARVETDRSVAGITQREGGWTARDADGRPLAEMDAVVLAGGLDVRAFAPTAWLPLMPRRGQISLIRATERSSGQRCVLHAECYAIPPRDGCHVVGATFDPVADAIPAEPQAVTAGDHRRNTDELARAFPSAFPVPEVEGGRAALRATVWDHLPLAGPVPDRDRWLVDYAALRTGDRRGERPDAALHPGLWVLSGLGARGFVTAPLAAELIAAQMTGTPWPVPRTVAAALHPGRAILRDLRLRRV